MASWFPDGITLGGSVNRIIPGGYAVVGKWNEFKGNYSAHNRDVSYYKNNWFSVIPVYFISG